MAACITNPNNLEVLLHCHVSSSPHPRWDAPAVKEAIKMLLHFGLIVQNDRHFDTTPKGAFYIQHLLKQPFPVETYTIPEVV